MPTSRHIQQKNHSDHNHIVRRLEQYINAYKSKKPEAMKDFYHPTNFVCSDFSADRESMGYEDFTAVHKEIYETFDDIEIKSLSVHGHKDFTAWEWEITCKAVIDPESRKRLSKEEAPPKKVIGCSLMWWEDDKIIRKHEYSLLRTPDEQK